MYPTCSAHALPHAVRVVDARAAHYGRGATSTVGAWSASSHRRCALARAWTSGVEMPTTGVVAKRAGLEVRIWYWRDCSVPSAGFSDSQAGCRDMATRVVTHLEPSRERHRQLCDDDRTTA